MQIPVVEHHLRMLLSNNRNQIRPECNDDLVAVVQLPDERWENTKLRWNCSIQLILGQVSVSIKSQRQKRYISTVAGM